MSQPLRYERQFNFTDFSTGQPSVQQPGVHLDAEFDALKETLDEVLSNLALIQRDDSQLRNLSVRLATLHGEVVAALVARGAQIKTWAPATAYAQGDFLIEDDHVYLTAIAHTSTSTEADAAANRIVRIFDTGITSDLESESGAAKVGRAGGGTVQSFITAVLSSLGAAQVGSIRGATGAIAESVAQWRERLPVDPVSFGAVVDDEDHDSGPALQKALLAAALLKVPLSLPRGRLYCKSAVIGLTGFGWPVGEGVEVYGCGPASIVRFIDEDFGALYGFDVRADNVTLRDFRVELIRKPVGYWIAGVALRPKEADTTPIKGFRIDRVHFEGEENVPGAIAVQTFNASLDDPVHNRLTGRYLDFGWVKGTSDVSTQRRMRFIDCDFEDCLEGLELNTPGLWMGDTVTGEPYLSNVVDANESASTITLEVGQEIESTVFPSGTTVVAVDQGLHRVELSENATATKTYVDTSDDYARISAGGIFETRIRGFSARRIRQWPIGIAHAKSADIDIWAEDCWHEAIHIEDHSSDIRIRAGGRNCNTVQGVVIPGAPETPNANANGMVHVGSGSRRVHVEFADADVGGADTSNHCALTVQIGGMAGTTGTEDLPTEISVSGRVHAAGGDSVIEALDGTHIAFNDFTHVNTDPASKSDTLHVPNGSFSGSISIVNPARVVWCGTSDIMLGVFGRIDYFSTEGGFPDLRIADGFFPVRRNSCPVARSQAWHVKVDVDDDADWMRLCPMPAVFEGTVSRLYHGTGGNHVYECGSFRIAEGALIPTDLQSQSGGNMELAIGRQGSFNTGAVAATTDGDTLISSLPTVGSLAAMASVEPGTPVSGSGIPAGAKVAALIDGTSLRMDRRATATASGVTVTFTPAAKSNLGWRVDAGWLEFRAYAASAETVDLVITMDGPFVPDVPL